MVPRKILDSLITKQVVEPGRKHCIHYTDENGKECECKLVKMTKDRAFFMEEPCITEELKLSHMPTEELSNSANIFSYYYDIRSLKVCTACPEESPPDDWCAYLAIKNIIRAGYDLFKAGHDPDYCTLVCTNLILGALSNSKREQGTGK